MLPTGCMALGRAIIARNVKPITGNWDILALANVVTDVDRLSAMFSFRAMDWAHRERRDLFRLCDAAMDAVEAAFYTRNPAAVQRATAQAEAAKQVLLVAYSESRR